jgi:hypothetical protein
MVAASWARRVVAAASPRSYTVQAHKQICVCPPCGRSSRSQVEARRSHAGHGLMVISRLKMEVQTTSEMLRISNMLKIQHHIDNVINLICILMN